MHSATTVIQRAPRMYFALKPELTYPRNWMYQQPGRDIVYHVHASCYAVTWRTRVEWILDSSWCPPYATGSWNIKKEGRPSPEVFEVGILHSISLMLSVGFGRRDEDRGSLVLCMPVVWSPHRPSSAEAQKHATEHECPQTPVNGFIFQKPCELFPHHWAPPQHYVKSKQKMQNKNPKPSAFFSGFQKVGKCKYFSFVWGFYYYYYSLQSKTEKSVFKRSWSSNYHSYNMQFLWQKEGLHVLRLLT